MKSRLLTFQIFSGCIGIIKSSQQSTVMAKQGIGQTGHWPNRALAKQGIGRSEAEGLGIATVNSQQSTVNNQQSTVT
ncbi:hypothetical protein QUB13_04770 [Microcoleus sp. B4-D4]